MPILTCVLKKPTETADAYGTPATTWEDVCSFSAHLVPLKISERIARDKDTVYANYRLVIPYSNILEQHKADLTEKNKLFVGSHGFEIKAVGEFKGPGRHWELDLLEIK